MLANNVHKFIISLGRWTLLIAGFFAGGRASLRPMRWTGAAVLLFLLVALAVGAGAAQHRPWAFGGIGLAVVVGLIAFGSAFDWRAGAASQASPRGRSRLTVGSPVRRSSDKAS